MISKRFSRDEIIAQFHDGQSIMTGGFAFHGCPNELFDCLVASGAKHLTNIALDASAARLMHLGIFDKVIIAHAGAVPENLALMASGKIEVEFCPMGTIAERIRAGGVGLGGILVKTGLGTDAQKGKELIEFNGETYILESALRADISLVRAATADHYGNLTYAGTARNSNPIIAMASDLTIVQTDRFIELDSIPPESIITPGIFVDMILDPEKKGGASHE